MSLGKNGIKLLSNHVADKSKSKEIFLTYDCTGKALLMSFRTSSKLCMSNISLLFLVLIVASTSPGAILAYEQIAAQAGLNNAQINQLQTADASPNGGHW